MPNTVTARDKIVAYLETNSVAIADLAVMYGVSKQELGDYLAGRKITTKGNQIILRIISDFKIR